VTERTGRKTRLRASPYRLTVPELREFFRVTIFLPINSIAEQRAAGEVGAELRSITPGATESSFNPRAFRGSRVDGDTIIEDDIALLLTGLPRSALSEAA